MRELCDKCGLEVPKRNNLLYIEACAWDAPVSILFNPSRHFLPVVDASGEQLCEGSPSRSQYITKVRDTRGYPFSTDLEVRYTKGFADHIRKCDKEDGWERTRFLVRCLLYKDSKTYTLEYLSDEIPDIQSIIPVLLLYEGMLGVAVFVYDLSRVPEGYILHPNALVEVEHESRLCKKG